MPDTADTLDLIPFCSRMEISSARFFLMKPFSIGEHTYATDGRLCVRVPRRPDVPESEDKNRFDLGEFFSKKLTCDCLPGDVVPILPPENRKTCPECDGDGDNLLGCKDCDDRGYTTDDDDLSIEVHGKPFGAGYIRLILGLPNVKIAKKLSKPREHIAGSRAVFFCFDGGEGVLMGMSRPNSIYIRKGETYEQAVLEALRKDNLATVMDLIESGFFVGIDEYTFRIAENRRFDPLTKASATAA